jgi:hypothetical protein
MISVQMSAAICYFFIVASRAVVYMVGTRHAASLRFVPALCILVQIVDGFSSSVTWNVF